MKDRYLITITTIHGTKHFNLHQIIKKVIIYIALVLVTVLVGGYYYISYLTNELTVIEKKRDKILKEKNTLLIETDKLKFLIDDRKVAFEALEDKIDDLEDKMGLTGKVFEADVNITEVDKNVMNNMLRLLPSGKPVKNVRMTSRFGWRKHPILKRRKFHTGLDFAGKGKIAIRAPSDGVVSFAGFNNGGYGYMVKVIHAYGFKTIYAHMRKNLLVKEGDFVTKGDVLGYVGNSGRSTGQHLHYEVRFINKPLDPLNFVRWSGKNFYKIINKEKRVPWQSLVKVITTTTNQSKHQKQP